MEESSRRRRGLLGALWLAAALGAAPAAAAEGTAPAPAGEGPPVNITADRMEYFNDRSLVHFTGSVVAVQGDTTTTSDEMEVTLGKNELSTGSVERMVATGSVTIRMKDPEEGTERFATGERAEYEAGENTLVLTGSPRAWEGQNVIVGEKMIFHLEDHSLVVEGEVGLTVYPKEESPGEEPPAPGDESSAPDEAPAPAGGEPGALEAPASGGNSNEAAAVAGEPGGGETVEETAPGDGPGGGTTTVTGTPAEADPQPAVEEPPR